MLSRTMKGTDGGSAKKYAGATFTVMMAKLTKIITPQHADSMNKEVGKILSLKGLTDVKLTLRDLEINAINAAMRVTVVMPVDPGTKLKDFDEVIDCLREFCLDWEATFIHPVRRIPGPTITTTAASDISNSVMKDALYCEGLLFAAAREAPIFKATFAITNVQLMFSDKSMVIYTFAEHETIKCLIHNALLVMDCINGPMVKSVEVRPLNCP